MLVVPGCAAALVLAAPARAQRAFVGVGAGLGYIHDSGTEESGVRPSIRVLAGYRVASGVSIVLEGTAHGLSEDARDFLSESEGETGVLAVQTLLLAARFDLGDDAYLRPGVGLGRHAFAFGIPTSTGGFTFDVSHEAGLAAGLTAGYAVRMGDNFSLNLEGVVAWSGGEDSTSSRVVGGVLVVPTWRF